ncbi:phosphatidate cytidylyltransferase [Rhodococcoides trifolii]|uniref:Phosphatidate cytidylyltransferase n=1 Tax=Rhodococcoides trifolii TaxID=908250 RepID=A0A917FUT4_9NOCA|nr:phosphatidate cytidylyltransferase [Rhodococcus trifolii]GGG07309.1 phosphatidate cytidylyltransferase [Rhodococcus trifolii]
MTSDSAPLDTPEHPEAVAKTSRAGRDLPAAIAVGGSLGVMCIVVLVFVPKVFIGVAAVAVAIATWEVAKRLREGGIEVPRIPLIVGGQAVMWFAWPYGAMGAVTAFTATVLVMMVWQLLGRGLSAPPQNFLRDTAISVFVLAWLPLLGAFVTMLTLEDNGGFRVLVLMIAVVCSDIGGYAAGVLFGRHPMAPAISPKKSWEGLGGSLLFCIAGCLCTVTFMLHANPLIGVLLGILVVFSATLGDLIESQVKRDLKIKDMGTLLPGHGGIMDRLDSVLPSVFVTWVVLTALV